MSRLSLRLLSGILTIWVLMQTNNAQCQMLIIQTSDNHSAYDRLPTFIKSISALRQEYLGVHPHGKVVLVLNGDFSGASSFSIDEGNLNYEVLKVLAREYEIILNLGNHEAFDWKKEHGNSLFVRQNADLVRAIRAIPGKENFGVLGANVKPVDDSEGIFKDYYDVETFAGRPVRFVGLVLDYFLESSTYDPNSFPKIFDEILPAQKTFIEQVKKAGKDGITDVVGAIHDKFKSGVKLASLPRDHVKVPAIFTGHDHHRDSTLIDGTWVVDSNSEYDFSMVELDFDNEVIGKPEFFNELSQLRAFGDHEAFSPAELEALALVEQGLEKAQAINGEVLGVTAGYSEIKRELKKGRRDLGNRIADSLTEWARDSVAEVSDSDLLRQGVRKHQIEDYVAFYNSSSFRRDRPIAAGPLTRFIPVSVYPMRGEGTVRVLRGEQIQSLYRHYRSRLEQEKKYSPQISSNLKVTKNKRLYVRTKKGDWKPLKKNGLYVLAMDPWMAANGYDVPGWDETLNAGTPVIIPSNVDQFTDVLVKYLPRYLSIPEDCLDKAALTNI